MQVSTKKIPCADLEKYAKRERFYRLSFGSFVVAVVVLFKFSSVTFIRPLIDGDNNIPHSSGRHENLKPKL